MTSTNTNAKPKLASARDELRAKIFSAQPKSAPVDDFFGTTIELRQPTLQVALSQRQAADEERVYFMLTEYAYVPGTNQKLFDREDIESLKELPFGPEFTRLIDAVNSLLGIKIAEVEASLQEAEKSD